jgi:ATP-dependent phosphofructokinase / diphosphate-dependent phosphofructokinase
MFGGIRRHASAPLVYFDDQTGEKAMRGGNLVVGQAGGATAVINASLVGVVESALAAGYRSVYGMRRGAEGALQDDYLDLTSLAPERLQALAATPGAALASSRRKASDDEIAALLASYSRSDVTAFVYIGGNDSADTVHRLARMAVERGLQISAIAVPKTIDNDLPVTDHSPGYGSIARYVAVATMDSAKDTESMPTMYPVKFIEVMGRDAGWVAAASALGKRTLSDPPHLIYVPERPVSRAQLLDDVRRVYKEFGYVVAVVTETMRDERGQPFADPGSSGDSDAFGHALLRGTAQTMVELVQSELGLRARFDKPGSLQRMSMAFSSWVDLEEAREAGRAAVRLASTGESDLMVTLVREADQPYRFSTSSAPLAAVANRQSLLPDDFLDATGRMTTENFRRYALPLLGPDPFPRYERIDDLPSLSLTSP